jgi:hypothetical protein
MASQKAVKKGLKKMSNMQPVGMTSFPQNSQPWRDDSKYAAKTFYCYESDNVANLAAAAAVNLTFNIAGDSDFFWTKFCAFALVGGVATTRTADQLPAATLLVVNTTTGRQYSSSAVPLPNMAGNAQFPFILPQITLWEKKSTIQLQLTNVGNATYSAIYLSFLGIKAFTK